MSFLLSPLWLNVLFFILFVFFLCVLFAHETHIVGCFLFEAGKTGNVQRARGIGPRRTHSAIRCVIYVFI